MKETIFQSNEPDIFKCKDGDWVNLLPQSKYDKNVDLYDNDNSVEIYRNFLSWLFATFKQSEEDFRSFWLGRLGNLSSKKIQITGCGLGEDISLALQMVGPNGFVHAQDLSKKFIATAAIKNCVGNAPLNASDALALPYRDNYFDAVYHFGGINLFGDIGDSHLLNGTCLQV